MAITNIVRTRGVFILNCDITTVKYTNSMLWRSVTVAVRADNNLILFLILYRSRTPQPPAEDEEENIDDTLVTIDTCN